jgi:ubiquinone/menaquinone biosynthesis C-methylase UbiE
MTSDDPIKVVERMDVHESADLLQIALHNQRYDFALRRLKPDDHVLEIGTGLGVFTAMLAGKCASLTGIEFDEQSFLATRQRLKDAAKIIQGDAQQLPFGPQAFSLIICLEVLEHLPNFRKAVAEIHRVAQENSRVIVSVPYRKHGAKSEINPYHLYEPGEDELITEFEKHFRKVEVFYQYFEETPLLTFARVVHLRRMLGLVKPYRLLTEGHPDATRRIKIEKRAAGMKMGLVLVISDRR